jgi:soluble lytic murein transglycosylase
MQFQAILTSIALAASLMSPFAAPAQAKSKPAPAAQAPSASPADSAILDLNQAYKNGDTRRMRELLPKVTGHALEPWAAYWELSARLDTASPNEIQAFLSRYAGTYQEDRLRNDWLLQLGRRKDWATFAAEYPKFRMNDDRSVRCYALLTDFIASGADVAAQVEDLWLAQREADEGCAAAAELQIRVGKFKTLSVWHRARLGFENDRVRIASQAAGLLNEKWGGTVSAIYANPAHYLNDKITAVRMRTKEFVTLALVRLAVTDTDAAAAEMEKMRWKTQLTQEEQSWIWGVIGKRAARRLSDDAIPLFAKGQDKFMHEDHLAWKARAALRANDWSQVRDTIAAMGEAQRQDPTWIYWRARALMALKSPDAAAQAAALYQSIASAKGFYEQLALEELGRQVTAPARPEPLTVVEKDTARNNPGLSRGLLAIQLGLRSEGVREWNYSIGLHQRGGMSDRELLAAAQLACDNSVWDRCINASERTKVVMDFEQRYPMPFKNEVLKQATKIGLDPAYVYGLIRQESRFIMDARSNVGASGLMQVMPATARWTARKIGLTDFQPHQITDRDTNIAIGTGYLKLVLENFGGSMPLATAAYNAGPNRPRNWRGQSGEPVREAAIWAENVPFTETRDYVKKVLANTTNYAAIITGQPQSLKMRLGLIGPRMVNAAEVTQDLP